MKAQQFSIKYVILVSRFMQDIEGVYGKKGLN